MYMLNYKNTCQRRTPLTQRVAAFLNGLDTGAHKPAPSDA